MYVPCSFMMYMYVHVGHVRNCMIKGQWLQAVVTKDAQGLILVVGEDVCGALPQRHV